MDQKFYNETEYHYYISFVAKGDREEFWFRNAEYFTDEKLDRLSEIDHLRKLIMQKDPHSRYHGDADVVVLGITYLGKQSRSYLDDINRFEFADPYKRGEGNGFRVWHGS